MSAVRLIRSGVLGVCVAALVALGGASSAAALSPWWSFTSGSRPTPLQLNSQSGFAKDEVQEIVETPGIYEGELAVGFAVTVKRIGSTYFEKFVDEPFAKRYGLPEPTASNLQKWLEAVAPGNNWTVTEGQAGALSLRVTSDGPAPVLQVSSAGLNTNAEATVVSAGRADGEIVVTAENVGDAPTNSEAQFTDVLPRGLRAVSIEGRPSDGLENWIPFECLLQALTCAVPEEEPYRTFEVVIGVVVEAGASGGETIVNEAAVTGGGAPAASIRRPIRIGGEPVFGPEEYDMVPEEEGGALDTQAGSHPFQLTTTVDFNQTSVFDGNRNKETFPSVPALAKDLNFKLPPGLIGNPTVLPECSMKEFLTITGAGYANECPVDTAVGVAATAIVIESGIKPSTFIEPVFNLEPAAGEPARFGFNILTIAGSVPVVLDTSIRTGEDYGVTVHVSNISQAVVFVSSTVTFWGVPGDPRHDNQRGSGCLIHEGECTPEGERNPPPFLSMPTSCIGPLQSSMEFESWTHEGVFGSLPSEPMPAMDGCNRLPFTPSVIVTPDGRAGSTPTGVNVDEHISQLSTLAPKGLAESDVKGLTTTLPEGVSIDPAGGDGLQACPMEAIGLEDAEVPACPEASKIGTATVRTPLLPHPLEGVVYLATQNSNPFGSLIAMYLFAEEPFSKTRAKATGEVMLNPVTGQVTVHFEGDPVFESNPAWAGDPQAQFLPNLPYEDVELHFFGGDRAPLDTPAKCGSYTTTSTFTPWSGNPPTESASTFEIISGPNGSPCQSTLPFKPTLTAGTSSIQAGGFSPFIMTMSREDGEQTLRSIELHMPAGLSGILTGVKLCGEEQANAGTCPPESEIGETIVSVGVGGDPFTVKGGKIYITGPYKGAPFGLSIVNPAKAGPFDLGKVIVRGKIEVNPETAALTITTDTEGAYKLPTILDGIPLEIRHVSVDINRPGFAFNPTNCSPLAMTGALGSTEGASSPVQVPFQITNCAVLAFKPKLEASTSGKTSRASGASLTVHLGYPAGPYDANIAKVKVELPKALPSRLTTLQKACKAAVFEANPAACPPASIVGHAMATTPEIPVPLTGPAYFVSHGGEAFPSLVIVLQGYGVTIHLVGSTFINKAGITSSTFKTVPDAPVGTFDLTLPQGQFSALAATGNFCKQKLAMPTEFVGQNGALIKTTTKIGVTGCGKTKKSSEKKSHHKAKRKHGGKRG